jgi:hypothetical protein
MHLGKEFPQKMELRQQITKLFVSYKIAVCRREQMILIIN